MTDVRKAVIPAAGLGTRFLPATKAQPKEMLPIVDKPAIQYAVEEAVRAGIDDILVVTGRNKRSLEDHFDRAVELEADLEAKGKHDLLKQVRSITDMARIHYVRQAEALGLGHAVSMARQHVGDEPFAVLLGDDLIDARDHLLEHMLAVQAEHGGSVVALLDVGRENIDKYGAVAVEPGAHPVLDGDERPRELLPEALEADRLATLPRPELGDLLAACGVDVGVLYEVGITAIEASLVLVHDEQVQPGHEGERGRREHQREVEERPQRSEEASGRAPPPGLLACLEKVVHGPAPV